MACCRNACPLKTKVPIVRELISAEQIRRGVAQLADAINDHYRSRPLTLLGVMTGSLVLVADVIRQLQIPVRVGVIQARSYRGAATTPGELAVRDGYLPDVQGRHVLVVDDIFDTGRTLAGLYEYLRPLQPASLRSAVLLRKQGRQQVSLEPDYVVFDIPDVFVVGYGLDYQDQYRHLAYVAALEPQDLEQFQE